MENFNKISIIDISTVDKSNVFLLVDSISWRSPNKISVQNLVDNIKIDPSSLQITVTHTNLSSVHSASYDNQNISYNQPPINASTLSGMHVVTDGNYLYVWIGNRWKRCILSEW